ncbi:hypothetical protein DXT99_14125 [Pontibacter diazotrophicus]|uniref:DUF4595 domain-containing protein n=1 Tax=Pontibacter diazotrophicus TaxID=1400979 RepID=A0A3D8LB49_9BACT|nr:hypothetical protein [Pontibacter diazotrophicus]RDV14534.1 hypothetical protein DXT99_14125 [Pontibacter diazotrophicus]
MKINSLYLVSLVLLLLSCGKENDETLPQPEPEVTSCKITETKVSDNGFVTTYFYDSEGLLKKVEAVLPNTSNNANYYELEYDADGRLIKNNWSIPSLNFYYQLLYTYNSAGQVTKLTLSHKNTEGNYVPSTYHVYEYTGPDEMKQRRLYRIDKDQDVLLETEDYFYENGLMVKVEFQGQRPDLNKVYELEYDDKKNHAYQSRVFNMQGYGYPFRHNITKTTALDYKGRIISNESTESTYTYTPEGYPATRTSTRGINTFSVAYTYNCK